MSAEEDLKVAKSLIREIGALWDSRCVSYEFCDAVCKAKNWVNEVDKPGHQKILSGIKSKTQDLLEFLTKLKNGFGVMGFIFCGNHQTMEIISRSLIDYCNNKMISGTSVTITKDDALVCIEDKGIYYLSVNSKDIPGAAFFAGGYLS